MLNLQKQQKRDWMENFSNVTALYAVFNEGRGSLRAKHIVPHFSPNNDRLDISLEVEALPIDFLMDVELKAKRALPLPIYEMFLRLAFGGNLEVLPEAAKLILGKAWLEYNLGVEGAYRNLYFKTKNEQIRSYLKGLNEHGVEPNQFD